MEIRNPRKITIDHLKLRGAVFASGKKVNQIATDTGLGRTVVSRIINGKFTTVENFEAVCRAINCNPSDFIDASREVMAV